MPNNKEEELKKLNEDYEDSLFRLVMNDIAEKEGKLLFEESKQLKMDSEDMPTQENIDRFTKLLDLHIKKAKKTNDNHTFTKILNRAAVIILVIIVFFSTAMVSVEAFRVQVLDFLINIETKYTSFQLNNSDDTQDNEKLIVNWTHSYAPTYIPDGYEVSSASDSDSIKRIKFDSQDNNLTIIYTDYNSTDSIAIDTEGASLVKTIDINGQEGTLAVKDSTTTVAWKINDHIFTIQGQINTDEATKMAEGVKYIEK